MKHLQGIILFFVFCTSSLIANDLIKFRVQCSNSSEKLPSSQLKKVEDLNYYILPSGTKLYFAGGVYDSLYQADSALLAIKNIGFQNAIIRVFKGDFLMSEIEGEHYILSLRLKPELQQEKPFVTAKTKDETFKEKKKDTVQQRIDTVVSKVPIEIKIEEKLQNKNFVFVQDESLSKSQGINESVVVNNSNIPNPPIYRIYLANIPNEEEYPEVVSKLENETIYIFYQNNRMYFLAGTFENQEAAFNELQRYMDLTPYAEVVAEYRKRIISLELANDLYNRYHNFPTNR